MPGRLRVFVACSLDGFVAGLDDDLSWLPTAEGDDPQDYGFARFLDQIGVVLMGRRTFDVVSGFTGDWPYAARPVLVATTHGLDTDVTTVRPVQGQIDALVAQARAVSADADIYLDGGVLIRQALDADLVDDITVSIAPTILGRGLPLFAGATRRQRLTLVDSTSFPSGLVQLIYLTRRT